MDVSRNGISRNYQLAVSGYLTIICDDINSNSWFCKFKLAQNANIIWWYEVDTVQLRNMHTASKTLLTWLQYESIYTGLFLENKWLIRRVQLK